MTNKPSQNGKDEPFQAIAVSSFLQMLEQEASSCTVVVQAGSRTGTLFLEDGELIDAEFENVSGIDAAYKIICWEDASIALQDATSRPRVIESSLSMIILNAACQMDEIDGTDETMTTPTITYAIKASATDPDYQATVEALTQINAIQAFFLLNKSGKVAVYSAANAAIGELIIYCIVTCSNLKKSIGVKVLKRIHLQMEDGSSLLILPLAGKIIGMILNAESSADEVVNQIQTALSIK